ncbi:MAG: DUF5368 family protein [Rhodomicrobiaceae bacterium]
MKELDPYVFLAVFQEMLGWWLWALLALAAFGAASFAYVIVRDRGLRSGRLLTSQLFGTAGGIAALFFMWWITSSSIRDVGGPIDIILVLAIWTGGFLGGAVLSYGLMGMARRRMAASMPTTDAPPKPLAPSLPG